jgi:hypothetical protein
MLDEDARSAAVLLRSFSLAPHCVQNRDPAALAWPQAVQIDACGAPHCEQNQLAAGITALQLGQPFVSAVMCAW